MLIKKASLLLSSDSQGLLSSSVFLALGRKLIYKDLEGEARTIHFEKCNDLGRGLAYRVVTLPEA